MIVASDLQPYAQFLSLWWKVFTSSASIHFHIWNHAKAKYQQKTVEKTSYKPWKKNWKCLEIVDAADSFPKQ